MQFNRPLQQRTHESFEVEWNKLSKTSLEAIGNPDRNWHVPLLHAVYAELLLGQSG
jgi:hypothetical protein